MRWATIGGDAAVRGRHRLRGAPSSGVERIREVGFLRTPATFTEGGGDGSGRPGGASHFVRWGYKLTGGRKILGPSLLVQWAGHTSS